MTKNFYLIVGFLLLFSSNLHSQTKEFTITFIANEGVMISNGEKKVLVDGLFVTLWEVMAYLNDKEKQFFDNEKKYKNVDIVISSHVHLDHFSSSAVGEYLSNNKNSIFVSTEQAIDSLKSNYSGFNNIKSRIRKHTDKTGVREKFEHNGIMIETIGIPHNTWAQNIGAIISFGGKKFLTVGDAHTSFDMWKSLNLTQEFDAVILPFWYFTNEIGRRVVDELINTKNLFGAHVDLPVDQDRLDKINLDYPDVVFLTKRFKDYKLGGK